MTPRQLAEAFSNGRFELAYPYLTEDIEWTVVGESVFSGRESVVQNCERTAKYFRSVTTNFKTINVIAEYDRVAVSGTAEFIREGNRVAFISACDVYEFDGESKLQRITSYCIPEKE